jgi:cyclopropane fatty-acyl-phospholipid synthase-like methyltransferase
MSRGNFWDERFSEPGYAYGTEPNEFLASQKRYFKPGLKALAVADGEGRNGVWLAQQGLDVLSVDQSAVGLAKARELAAQRGVSIRTEQVDLTTWNWPEGEFDAVVAIFIHFPPAVRARMHERMYAALKPGGVLILEAFTPKQLEYKTGGPQDPAMLYTMEMLRMDFPAGERLLLEEMITGLNEGPYHRGQSAVVRLVLRKI